VAHASRSFCQRMLRLLPILRSRVCRGRVKPLLASCASLRSFRHTRRHGSSQSSAGAGPPCRRARYICCAIRTQQRPDLYACSPSQQSTLMGGACSEPAVPQPRRGERSSAFLAANVQSWSSSPNEVYTLASVQYSSSAVHEDAVN
jgi:hypothetical protein